MPEHWTEIGACCKEIRFESRGSWKNNREKELLSFCLSRKQLFMDRHKLVSVQAKITI